MSPTPKQIANFWAKVKKDIIGTGCWEWIACLDKRGYGKVGIAYKTHAAHRVAYELVKGKIPEGLTLDHLCRNPKCVNPNHLEAVTQRENTLRGLSLAAMEARQTHCKNGHPLSGDNISKPTLKRYGYRKCLTCERTNRWLERHMADIDKVRAGDTVKIENGYTNSYKGELQLATGKFGKISRL